MKVIHNTADQQRSADTAPECSVLSPWKILLVDDEPDILAVTRLALKNFKFLGRTLHFLEAQSAAEARRVLQQENEIAIALIDVVMESDDAGLELVNHIRNDLNNSLIRLIIRTGQPGAAPERGVVDRYDIDDYKEKTELTAMKLYTTVRTALKSYHDLVVINDNRRGLEKILDASPELYHPNSLQEFFDGVLTQIISLCNLGHHSCIAIVNDGAIVSSKNEEVTIQSSRGHFADPNSTTHQKILQECTKALLSGDEPENLPSNIDYIPLRIDNHQLGFVCIEHVEKLNHMDRHLVHIMINQSASALRSINLYEDLTSANHQAMKMLAIAAEFRDKETGDHIGRIQHSTYRTALKLGLSEEEAEEYGLASILHDIGKIALPDAILQKPGKLTEEEFDIIKRHTTFGVGILDNSDWLELAKRIAYSHHERWDGSGYPLGLKGEEINLAARIVAVVDVYDALTHKRVYKAAWSQQQALDELRNSSGVHFDPMVVKAFIELIENGELYPE